MAVERRTADVVVIGAGVIGSATAYQLALSGRSVVVVDKLRGPGQGSTSASSAVVRFNSSTYAGVAMSWEAKHCWEHFRDYLQAPMDESLGLTSAHSQSRIPPNALQSTHWCEQTSTP